MLRMTRSLRGNETALDKVGSFMGFEDSSDSDSEENIDVEQGAPGLVDNSSSNVLLQSNLLKGLPNWLDRLFEGTTQCYYINYWPDFPTK